MWGTSVEAEELGGRGHVHQLHVHGGAEPNRACRMGWGTEGACCPTRMTQHDDVPSQGDLDDELSLGRALEGVDLVSEWWCM